MALQFATLGSKKLTRRIFIYGDTGTGKTEFIGGAQGVPETADVLHGNIDGGGATLASRGDVLSTRVSLASEIEELLWLMAKPADKRSPELQRVNSVALDGTTHMQQVDLAGIAVAAALKKDSRNKDLNELQDYKLNKGKMERLIRMACDLNDLWVFGTAWTKREYPKDASGQAVKTVAPLAIKPDLTDGLSKTVMGLFDDVWYLEKVRGSETRMLYTGEYKNIFAKTRDRAVAAEMSSVNKEGVTVPIIVNPTFADIYARYKRAYKLA